MTPYQARISSHLALWNLGLHLSDKRRRHLFSSTQDPAFFGFRGLISAHKLDTFPFVGIMPTRTSAAAAAVYSRCLEVGRPRGGNGRIFNLIVGRARAARL